MKRTGIVNRAFRSLLLLVFFPILLPPTLTLGLENINQVEKKHKELLAEAVTLLEKGGDWKKAKTSLEEARSLIIHVPKGNYYYRSPEADFYYAWVLCREPNSKGKGAELFQKILKNDALSPEMKSVVTSEMGKCRPDTSGNEPQGQPVVSSELKKRVIEKFGQVTIQKGGEWSEQLIIQGRLKLPDAGWNQRDLAKEMIRNTLGSRFNVVEAEPFLVVGRHPQDYLKKLAQTVLHPYYAYFTDQLGDTTTGGILYAFVTSDHLQFVDVARKIYDMKPGTNPHALDMAIAFSDLEANTMMAICGANPADCNSFTHELFHLLNSGSFEDAPWWLYEGMAELYESPEKIGSKYSGKVSWRKRDLRMETFGSADLRKLLELSKNDSTLNLPPGAPVAMARARFFCQYLDQLDRLWPIYHRLRSRPWEEVLKDPSGITVIQKEMGEKSIETISNDFLSWMKSYVAPIKPSTPGP